MLGGGARGRPAPSPAPIAVVGPLWRYALVGVACFAIGFWTSIALAYRLRPPPSVLVVGLGIASVALVGTTLLWVRVALVFMRSSEQWRARAWARGLGADAEVPPR
jgi:hypothetical protein